MEEITRVRFKKDGPGEMLDAAGATASMVCAIHCALMPLW